MIESPMKIAVGRRLQRDPEAAVTYWIGLHVRGDVADALPPPAYRASMMESING